jgi:circadian clock protein KaiC
MTSGRVKIRKIPSGIPGLDEVLVGGIPEFSFNLIAGAPGCGKTTLGHQIMFANATPERKAIYFTIIGEPPLKMLRYQQQFSFFDATKIGDAIRFVHLGEEAKAGGLAAVLARIEREIQETNPAFVFVDAFRSMFRKASRRRGDELEPQDFVQRLAVRLTSCEATTFLLGEQGEADEDNAVLTVADGIVWLYQERSTWPRCGAWDRSRGFTPRASAKTDSASFRGSSSRRPMGARRCKRRGRASRPASPPSTR